VTGPFAPRVLALAGLVGSVVLAAGCGDVVSNPQTSFNPRSEYANAGLDLFNAVIIAGVAVAILVEAILIWAAIWYRRRVGDRLPPQIHGNTFVEVFWTSVPAIVLAFILVPTIKTIFETQAPAPANAMPVEVIGHQFWWEFRYPDANVVTANELHLPVNRTASLILHSDDVIHSFWIPALGGKRDAFPGHTDPCPRDTAAAHEPGCNYLWMTPNSTGTFPGQCYQLCGYSHANMRERAVIQSQADFDAWVSAQQQPAPTPAPGTPEAEGVQTFQQKGCAGCHTIQGVSDGNVGPNLTHLASRGTIAGSVLENTAGDLRTWLHDPPAIKPGSIMPNLGLNDHELDVLVAYLQSLR
jgi:cytochrome c oxidase subunit II